MWGRGGEGDSRCHTLHQISPISFQVDVFNNGPVVLVMDLRFKQISVLSKCTFYTSRHTPNEVGVCGGGYMGEGEMTSV